MEYLSKIRDYCYLLLLIRNDDAYAKQNYKTIFKVIWVFYYIGLMMAIALIVYKSNIKVPVILKSNIIAILLFAIIMFTPYYLIVNRVLNKLPEIVNPITSNENINRRAITVLGLIFFIGIVFMFIPVIIGELI